MNKYMLMTNSVRNNLFPSTTHVDGSARVQVVTTESENFFKILTNLEILTGYPEVILNTSFNRKNEPIINSLETGFDFLINSEASFMVLDDFLITK